MKDVLERKHRHYLFDHAIGPGLNDFHGPFVFVANIIVQIQPIQVADSLSAQVSYYSTIIQNQPGWLYCGVYTDEAKTGTKAERPGFQKLLTDCRAGKIDMVITKSISRFSRNTVVFLETIRELKGLGVDVFFEEQNIHTMTGAGELMITLIASFAQEESLSASENVKWRIKNAFEQGEDITLRHLYGYRIERGIIEIDPETAPVVREVFHRVRNGESIGSITADLNRHGIPSPAGFAWHHYPITAMLMNEKYTGNSLLMKTYINNHIEKKKVKNQGERPMYYAEDTHPAIIDMETFEAVQEILNHNIAVVNSREKPIKGPFTSLIRCERCGANFRRCKNHDVVFWNCRSYIKHGTAGCQSNRIRESTLMEITATVAPIEEIEQISAGDGVLTYTLKSGETIQRKWSLPSRSESWTDEMRKQAAEQAKKQKEGI